MAEVRAVDVAGRVLERAAIPRWIMRSMLLGAFLFLAGALGMWLWAYSNRPDVLITFFGPNLLIVLAMFALASATVWSRSVPSRMALIVLALLPVLWVIGAAYELMLMWPAGWKWSLPAGFRLVFLIWVGIEVVIGAGGLAAARTWTSRIVSEMRLVPALLGAPQAMSELANGRGAVYRRLLAAMFLFTLAALQIIGLLVLPEVAWGNAIELCKGPPVAENAACFSELGNLQVLGQVVIWPSAFLACVWAGRKCERSGQNLTRDTAAEVMSRDDTNAPILFLRAFKNDQVALPSFRSSLLQRLFGTTRPQSFLDHLLVEEFAVYGPTIALGRPGQPVPPFGVWRTYLHDATEEQWQAEITSYANKAKAIVMVCDDTKGVAWELQNIVAVHLAKTVLIAPPEFADASRNDALWRSVTQQAKADAIDVPSAAAGGGRLAVFLDSSGAPVVATSGRFVAADYVVALRWFFRSRFPDAT